MRVARIRIGRFRGYRHAALVVPENMVLAGEPQAGRTDIVEALRRVLDARSTRSRVNPLDVYRPADRGYWRSRFSGRRSAIYWSSHIHGMAAGGFVDGFGRRFKRWGRK